MNRLSPLLICGFRPFFLLTAASATLFMLAWLLLLNGWWSAWNPAGGIILWHAHELTFGFIAAATAGFALTAVPEFTRTAGIGGKALLPLLGLWLLARLFYLLSSFWPPALGLWPAAFCNLVFWLLLLRLIAPPLWNDPGRQHLSFVWVITCLGLLQLGFFITQLTTADALPWIRAAIGVVMILIVIATSRISMSVVNGRIEEGRPGGSAPTASYLARPPRRYLAILCIAICSASEFVLGHHSVTGWVALAAAAAMFNLLNDWHVGRALFSRWALMLYASYWLIALGYASMGAAWLGAPFSPSVGRHLLTSGAATLAIFTVMALVARIHAGLWLDRRPWLPLCAILLVIASLLRALAGLPLAANAAMPILSLSGLLWAFCFVAYLHYTWAPLTGPREDGLEDCSGPQARNDDGC